jgi:DNA-binding transcriptional regulator YiaG
MAAMTNHPNRGSKWLSNVPRPHPDEIRDLRADRTQTEMAALAGLGSYVRWLEWESGVRKPHWAVWELLLLHEDKHPEYKLVARRKPGP